MGSGTTETYSFICICSYSYIDVYRVQYSREKSVSSNTSFSNEGRKR